MLLNHKRSNLNNILCAAILLLGSALVSCSSTKETLGLNKQVPDEFAVVKRAPLELPPNYTLRPPRPGTPRPQEQAPIENAREVVFGAQETSEIHSPSSPEEFLLKEAGAGNIDPDIRTKVDKESSEYVDKNKPVAEKLLDLVNTNDETPASVVDPKKEAERIKSNAEQGKPINDGETPTIEE